MFRPTNSNDDVSDEKLRRCDTDESEYAQSVNVTVDLTDKLDVLYLRLMQRMHISNMSAIKLLSANFIYNKSMCVEKFVYNALDEDISDSEDNKEKGRELYLYFIHLYDASDSKHKRHRTRTRNMSVASNYSTYSALSSYSDIARMGGGNGGGYAAIKSTHYTANSNTNTNSWKSQNKQNAHHSVTPSTRMRAQLGHTKVLLNLVQAKRSEGFTITDSSITIATLRNQIRRKLKVECDRMKLGNTVLMDEKSVRDYKMQNNDIVHVYDDSNLTLTVSERGREDGNKSVHGQKGFEVKINRKLTIKHIKLHIAKMLRYPIMSQTLIHREVLRDEEVISECHLQDGDSVRLVFNYGRRVRKLANERLKVPVVTFNTNQRFEVVVFRNMLVLEMMQIIESEKGIASSKQRLMFHGTILEKEKRVSEYNISHEVHLLILNPR